MLTPTGQQAMMDLEAGRAARDEGIDKVGSGTTNQQWLWWARRVAVSIVLQRGEVTTDDLQHRLRLPPGAHVNLWGAVLRAPHFKRTGRQVQSKRPEAHARWIQVWGRGKAGPRP